MIDSRGRRRGATGLRRRFSSGDVRARRRGVGNAQEGFARVHLRAELATLMGVAQLSTSVVRLVHRARKRTRRFRHQTVSERSVVIGRISLGAWAILAYAAGQSASWAVVDSARPEYRSHCAIAIRRFRVHESCCIVGPSAMPGHCLFAWPLLPGRLCSGGVAPPGRPCYVLGIVVDRCASPAPSPRARSVALCGVVALASLSVGMLRGDLRMHQCVARSFLALECHLVHYCAPSGLRPVGDAIAGDCGSRRIPLVGIATGCCPVVASSIGDFAGVGASMPSAACLHFFGAIGPSFSCSGAPRASLFGHAQLGGPSASLDMHAPVRGQTLCHRGGLCRRWRRGGGGAQVG